MSFHVSWCFSVCCLVFKTCVSTGMIETSSQKPFSSGPFRKVRVSAIDVAPFRVNADPTHWKAVLVMHQCPWESKGNHCKGWLHDLLSNLGYNLVSCTNTGTISASLCRHRYSRISRVRRCRGASRQRKRNTSNSNLPLAHGAIPPPISSGFEDVFGKGFKANVKL